MSLRINNNIASVNGHRNMVKNDMAVSKSLEKLSSGLRINRAADDAAGLIISEQMRAQIAGLDQATANSEQAVSMVQTAEGALDEMNSVLKKARQLAIHAANAGVNDSTQLTADQTELDNITSSITRIAANTQFGTKKILDGTLSDSQINNATAVSYFKQVGMANGTYDANVTTAGVKGALTAAVLSDNNATALSSATAATSIALGDTMDVATVFSIKNATGTVATATVAAGSTFAQGVAALNAAIKQQNVGVTVGGGTAGVFTLNADDVGTYSNALKIDINNGVTNGNYTSAAISTGTAGVNGVLASINGQSWALDNNRGDSFTSTTTAASITISTAAHTTVANNVNAVTVKDGAVFQIGANQNQTTTVSIAATDSTSLGRGSSASASQSSLQALTTNKALVNGNAQSAIAVIDKAIDDVTNQRGRLGAVQADTLETTLNSLRVTHENLTAAESTIRDVDYAHESATFTRNNILVQASTAMLAQANQLPQAVLKLLG